MKLMFKIVFLILAVTQLAWAKTYPSNPVQVTTHLSQTKLVQHGSKTIFVDVTLTPPASNQLSHKRATDIIIILDRSGSMSEAKKMTYAKTAISNILGRLNDNDRFALVSFSDNAIVQSPLVNVSSGTRNYLNNIVRSIHPSGGTNLGAGLTTALQLLQNNHSEHAKKILLLSDGQANKGITHPDQLAQIASTAAQYGAVVSTIGMGLGFNETLMSKISDYGMGNYSYLEDLSGLASILTKDLKDTRNIYASSSTLEIHLGHGVQLEDAGGYPLVNNGDSNIKIITGQILSNTPKHFVMTFNIPTHNTGTLSLGSMQLNYQVKNRHLSHMIHHGLNLTIVAPEYRQKAQESINKEVYKRSWSENNLGRMNRGISQYIREGKKDKAKQVVMDYRKEVNKAAASSQISLASPAVKEKLEEMESQIDDAFSGDPLEQKVKRNRAAKIIQFRALNLQRNVP